MHIRARLKSSTKLPIRGVIKIMNGTPYEYNFYSSRSFVFEIACIDYVKYISQVVDIRKH